MITAEQLRAGRALLRWDQADVERASGVSLPTIKRLEGSSGLLTGHAKTLKAIETTLVRWGVIFEAPASADRGYGVRLTKSAEAVRDIVEIAGSDAPRKDRLARGKARIAAFREAAEGFYAGEPDDRERVRSEVAKLKDRIRLELNRHPIGSDIADILDQLAP
jgi:transcriptional regulator with XRE-family HTH domain